ncbi:MAG: S8 family serine peptidase, partial [Candidatus Lokiarchaeota archaeon]|nr:S8 family serine peptidase [Candidatus Lokiarchaeota archaeon]
MTHTNRRIKAIVLLLCVCATSLYVTALPSHPSLELGNNAPRTLCIDPALLSAMEEAGPDEVVPVIVIFDADTCAGDSSAFLRAMAGSSFVLTHRFSIIPGISGRVRAGDLDALASIADSISFRVCENENVSVQLAPRVQVGGDAPAGIGPSQTTNWWHDAIGRNQTLVQGLDLSAVKVGVIDTGIGFERSGSYAVHSDLAGSIVTSVNFASGTSPNDVYDWYGHGTHVAGIIAASSQSFPGVAPGVKVYNIKVLNGSGAGLEEDIILGIEYAVNESLDIINLSLGGGNPDPLDPQSMAIKNATEQGVVAVIANGNSGPGYFTVTSPAAAVGAVSVGAVDQLREVTGFSSWGPSLGAIFKPDVVAPGEGIVSTLGSNSFLQKYYGYFELTMSGETDATNDYVALGGTSMAAPMVAGAAALILAKYRPYDLAPSTVAASLLESAGDLGFDACQQGMGIINITGAIAFLESIRMQNNLTQLARICPKRIPYAPYDIIGFPGQGSSVMVKVLHHGIQDVHWDTTPIPAGIQLSIGPNATAANASVGLTLFSVSITTSFDALPGNYSIDLILKNASDGILDNVTVQFTLRAPKLKVYLDSYHSLEDRFPRAFPISRFAMDYYPYIKYLAAQGIEVDTGMEYWTAGYNASQQRTPFVDSWLTKYDVVIIPPLKSTLFDAELAALLRFHDAGGHIVLLGSRRQEFSLDGGNAVLETLGMATRFTGKNVHFIRDSGWEHDVVDILLTDINSSTVLGAGVTKLAWRAGCTLDNDDPSAPGVVFSSDGDTLAAMLPAAGGSGSILVVGSESILPASMDAVRSTNNTRFFDNLFNYTANLAGPIRIDIHTPTRALYNESSLEVYFHVANVTTGAHHVQANLTAAACTVSNASGVLLQVGLGDLAGEWFGNSSLDITALAHSPDPYRVTLNVTIGAQHYTRRFAISRYDRSAAVPVVEAIAFSGFRGGNLSIAFNTVLDNETLILGGNPADIFSTKNVTSSAHGIVGSNGTTIYLGSGLPAGWYLLNAMHATRTEVDPFEASQRTLFLVGNHEPTIDQQASSFEGTRLSDIDLGNGMVRIMTAPAGQPLQVILAGADNESSQGAMAAFAIFYPICIIGSTAYLIPYGSQPIMSELDYDAPAGHFGGSVTIPAAVTFQVGSSRVARQFTSWEDYAGALILVLRDDDGSYDAAYVFLNLTSGLDFDWTWFIVAGAAAAIFGLVAIVLKRRRRAARPGLAGRAPRAAPLEAAGYRPKLRFCPYCGAEIRLKT